MENRSAAFEILTVQQGRKGERSLDLLAAEEPLEIRLGHRKDDRWVTQSLSITMRTPGHDFELAAGFLLGERIIRAKTDIAQIAFAGKPDSNLVRIDLGRDVLFDPKRIERNFYTTSSCGVCGKGSLEAISNQGVESIPVSSARFPARSIHSLPTMLRQAQTTFSQTGGLHAAALFSWNGELLVVREDVGRHNAVDKVIGYALLGGGLLGSCAVMLVSGRASFELAQKSIVAGIPILAAVGAPSTLAVDLAREFDLTLLGFVRDGRYNIYSGENRIDYEVEAER